MPPIFNLPGSKSGIQRWDTRFGPKDLDELDDEDPSYLLNTLYYTDAISDDEPSPYLDAMKRKKWLFEAYQDFLS